MWSCWIASTSLLLSIHSIQVILAQTACSINGGTYMDGEALGDAFTTRCGSAQEFPCFCRPNAPSQIDCPYCGIATTDNSAGLECARIDGPFINITTLEGDLKECTCRRDSSGNPETVCFPRGSIPNGNDAPSPSPNQGDNVCTLEWADGSVSTFTDGQSYGDLFSTQCGPPSDYPCFCNVSIPGKLYCPYCPVTTESGDVACGGIGDTFQVVDQNGQNVSCLCQDDLEANCTAISATTTTNTPEPTWAPTPAASSPTIRPLFVPSPTMVQTTTTAPTLVPTVPVPTTRPPSAPLPTFDKPSILLPTRTPPISVPVPGCSYVNETTGLEEFIAKGETLISMQGPCSPLETFPVVCNPALPGGVEYPYCVFVAAGQPGTGNTDNNSSSQVTSRSSESSVTCGKNGDQVQVPTADGTIQSCSCLYLNPFIGAVSSCPDLIITIPLASTMTPNAPPSSSLSSPPNVVVGPAPAPVPSPGPPTTSSDNGAAASINSSGDAMGPRFRCWSRTGILALASIAASALLST